jgi:hypothetical protein
MKKTDRKDVGGSTLKYADREIVALANVTEARTPDLVES